MLEKLISPPTALELTEKVNQLVEASWTASGGGSKMLYTATLPPSIYYDQAVTFQPLGEESVTIPLKSGQFNMPEGMQLVCGGYLYYMPLEYESYSLGEGTAEDKTKYYRYVASRNIYVIDLDTGAVVDSIPYLYSHPATNTSNVIQWDTNGDDKIYVWRTGRLEEINVHTKSVTLLTAEMMADSQYWNKGTATSTYYYRGYMGASGAFCYNPVTEKIYKFGGAGGGQQPGTDACIAFNLKTGRLENLAPHPSGNTVNSGTVIYIDPVSGDIYFTRWLKDTDCQYYRYNVATNTYTVIKTNAAFLHWQLTVCQLGDVCYLFGGKSVSGVNCINPRTGEVLSPVAVNSPLTNSNSLYYHYGAAVYGNAIYSYTRSKAAEGKGRLRRAEFFTQPPEDAPVVCKIFQGQKYHALRPFIVERLGLEIKKTQQTAQEDIVIKMYDYSAAGGQTIYIET